MELLKLLRTQWDRSGAVLAVIVGAVMLVVGWAGVSRSGLAAEQIPYVISCGVGGLFVLGVGSVLWISADLRDEWHKLDSVEDAIRSEKTAGADLVVEDVPTAPVPTVDANGTASVRARKGPGRSRSRATAQ